MNEEELKKVIDIVAGIEVHSEAEAIAKEELMSYAEQLQQENKELKKQLYSPDQVEEICPKCGEKFTVNYSREVYDLKYILTKFEKWLENEYNESKNKTDIFHNFIGIKTCLDKLQELKEGKK